MDQVTAHVFEAFSLHADLIKDHEGDALGRPWDADTDAHVYYDN